MPRLNADIPFQLYKDLCDAVPWGMRSRLYRDLASIIVELTNKIGPEVVMWLDDIKKSISKMSSEELLTLVSHVRKSRHTEKEIAPPSKGPEKRPTKAREKRSTAIASLLGGLSESQIADLAAKLQGDPEVAAFLAGKDGE